eukprot:1336284-Ditylum_brightwellii.AAC.1
MEEMELINWNHVSIALEQQHLNNKIQLVKCMHHWLNIGHQKKHFDKNTVAECPICQSVEETWTHLFLCQHNNIITIQMLALTTFKSELLKLGTAPIIKQVMYYKITQWCNMPTSSAPRIPNDKI